MASNYHYGLSIVFLVIRFTNLHKKKKTRKSNRTFTNNRENNDVAATMNKSSSIHWHSHDDNIFFNTALHYLISCILNIAIKEYYALIQNLYNLHYALRITNERRSKSVLDSSHIQTMHQFIVTLYLPMLSVQNHESSDLVWSSPASSAWYGGGFSVSAGASYPTIDKELNIFL